jgi:peptide/nickel transport system substrate-binding protein
LLAQEQTGEICDWHENNCQETDNVTGAMRRVQDLPLWDRMALFFNFEIGAEEDGFIGSGELDGEGIPPDFFADVHVRRAFAACFDRRAFIEAGMGGDGFLFRGLLPAFIVNPTLQEDLFPYRLQLCSQELALAWDGLLPTTGFRVELPFEAGNPAQQAVAVLLQTNLRAVNPNYRVDVVGLPAPLLQQELHDRRAPLALVSWHPALPDPYYWVAPAFSRAMAAYQSPPVQMQIEVLAHLNRLRAAVYPSSRAQALEYLQRFYVDELPFIQLPQTSTIVYQQRRLKAWLYHAADPLPYYYAYALR